MTSNFLFFILVLKKRTGHPLLSIRTRIIIYLTSSQSFLNSRKFQKSLNSPWSSVAWVIILHLVNISPLWCLCFVKYFKISFCLANTKVSILRSKTERQNKNFILDKLYLQACTHKCSNFTIHHIACTFPISNFNSWVNIFCRRKINMARRFFIYTNYY